MDQIDLLHQQELDEQNRRDLETAQRPESPDFHDSGLDPSLQKQYDHPDTDMLPQDLPEPDELPPDSEFVEISPSENAVTEPEESVLYKLPDQEEINELAADVTSIGLDDEVLGRDNLQDAIRSAEEAETKGGSYVEAFSSTAQRLLSEKHSTDSVEAEQTGIPDSQPTDQDLARERYLEHKGKLEASYKNGGSWHRDTIDAYHRMGMTYNAYLSGEKIDGLPVTKVDVFLKGMRFYQSNIFETAIIRAVKFACGVIKDSHEEKVEVEQNATDKGVERETPLRDDLGAFDHGDATGVAREEISAIRVDIPEYGIDLGIDSTKGQTYNSTENVKIFQPTDYVAKIDIGDGKTFNVPGMRLVEIGDSKTLVGPDGKVAFESARTDTGLSASDRTRIENRCDTFESRNVRDPFADLAQTRGVSVDDLKTQYADRAKDMYASRVENNMLAEANRLETRTIPEAKEELKSFQEDYSKLDKLETAVSRGDASSEDMQPTDIQSLKAELRTGVDVLQDRISAVESRVELLRDVRSQVNGSTIEDRFTRAATTEDHAVGRAGRIEYISNDTDKKIVDMVDRGTDKILGDVEKFNAANPESSVSYDHDSGELYNRFGVSESGKYDEHYATVDKSELPSDSPDSIQEHISKYADTDFDKWREFESDKPEQPQDVEKPEPDMESSPPETPQPDVEQPSAAETATQLPEEQPIETAGPDAATETELPSKAAKAPELDAGEKIGVSADETVPEPEGQIEPEREQISVDEITDLAAVDKKVDPNAEDETLAQAVAAHDDGTETPAAELDKQETSTSDGSEMERGVHDDISDKVKEILDDYFSDTDGLMSPENDVIQPISDLLWEAGIENYSQVFDTISKIMAGQTDVLDHTSKFTDLVEGFIEVSPVPANAYEAFEDSMLEAGVPYEISDAVMEDMLSLDNLTEPFDIGAVNLTIGEQDLTIDPTGIYDVITGEPAGGFTDDQSADRFFEQADQSLYERGADMELPGINMEVSNPDSVESLQPDFDMLGVRDVVPGEEVFDVGVPEAPADIPGAIEGVEAAESAAEGIEAAAAALL